MNKPATALYRLPYTDSPILIAQLQGEPQILTSLQELNGRKGFVIAPFRLTSSTPAVLIRPDLIAKGWDQIHEVLQCHPELKPGIISCGNESVESSEPILKKAYEEAFGRFITPLRQGQFRKLVLSRSATYPLPQDFSVMDAFIRACKEYPRMMISLHSTPFTGTWMGSTPEIILSGNGRQWHTVALAGTVPLIEGEENVTWSEKNRKEQVLVTEYIREVISRFGTQSEEQGPYTARAGRLLHLKTDFKFQIDNPENIGNLLEALHPTPAVCGLPKQEAYDFIIANEGYDRSYYAGVIGWTDPDGDTNLFVNLRCMQLTPHSAVLYAGGGLLPSSDPELEWNETLHKMATIKNTLTPNPRK